MLGDIFGRRAGLTCTELLLFLFLPVDFSSPRLPGVAPRGEARGLGKTELVALSGALRGPYLGVFRAERVGVVSLSLAPTVFIGVREGFVFAFAGSGKTMSSIICSMSASAIFACSFRLDGRCGPFAPLPACFRIFINDAGVAGALSNIGKGAGTGWDPGCFAAKCGDLLAGVDLGVAGGGIKISDKGSGDIDSASELSWL